MQVRLWKSRLEAKCCERRVAAAEIEKRNAAGVVRLREVVFAYASTPTGPQVFWLLIQDHLLLFVGTRNGATLCRVDHHTLRFLGCVWVGAMSPLQVFWDLPSPSAVYFCTQAILALKGTRTRGSGSGRSRAPQQRLSRGGRHANPTNEARS